MLRILHFFFGNGWVTLWYLAIYVLTVPISIFFGRDMWSYARSGGGPSGLGVLVALIFTAFLFGCIGLVNGLIFAIGGSELSAWARAGAIGCFVIGIPIAIFIAGIPLGNGHVWGWWIYHTALVAALLANLVLLYVATH
jgi:hypothetical protein